MDFHSLAPWRLILIEKRKTIGLVAGGVAIVILIGAGLYLYRNQSGRMVPPPKRLAASTPAPVVRPAATAAPTPRMTAPDGSPFGTHLAPPGVFYMLERISETTDSGVYAIDPGTKVLLLKRKAQTIQVTDGVGDFEVKPGQITNDLEAAALASRKDAASRQALAAWRATQ